MLRSAGTYGKAPQTSAARHSLADDGDNGEADRTRTKTKTKIKTGAGARQPRARATMMLMLMLMLLLIASGRYITSEGAISVRSLIWYHNARPAQTVVVDLTG